ncbi:hypothetical protein HII31_06415 [Pseudocercospora fuligena]|uniref:Uncharacterized protein n=1 Tax=Pseudocercospora fuligena TaxID=685502 RepID=A0A8H6RK82_9PEZI|nr:hypothetical protein HII31_06415 [Pseudocercospora fuligena]
MKFLSLLAISSLSALVSARYCNDGYEGTGKCERLNMNTFCCSVNGKSYGQFYNWKSNAWTTDTDASGNPSCGGWVNGAQEGAIYCSP